MAWFSHSGARIWYEEEGHGAPVLLLPGFSDRIAHYKGLREVLARNDRVIAADLPGSGLSLPQPRTYNRGYYDADAKRFVALLQFLKALPAHVLGHSDGGETALVIAVTSPSSVRSLLTWGATGFVDDPNGAVDAFFNDLIDAPTTEQQTYRTYLVDTYGADMARAMTKNFATGLRAIVAEGGDISRQRAGAIRCPVLLLHGENETFFDFSLVEALAAAIPGAIAEEVTGAGHGIHTDRPDWFKGRVISWLQGAEMHHRKTP